MGRIVSPSKPSAPAVVYIPTSAPVTASSADLAGSEGTAPTPTPAEVEAEKVDTLLRRNRSRLGTVLTGFRGVLDQNTLAAPRKTLLGE